MSHLSFRHVGNRLTGRECAHKGGAISDRRTDDFAEAGQLFDELSTLERPRIDPIGHEN